MKKLKQIALSLVGIVLLFGISPGYSFLATADIAHMDQKMALGPCQAACTPSELLIIQNQKTEVDEKDTEPSPADSSRLVFTGVGWTTIAIVPAAYLFKYLRWRPPDIFSLNSYYRF